MDKESEFYGCADADSTHDDCSAALTDNDFAYGGATYTVDTLYWQSSADRLLLGVANVGGAATKAALAGLTLNVNGDAFAVSDAEPLTNFIDWTYDPSPDWADGQRVSVSLTAAVSRPEMPTGLTATAGNAQVALAWTDPDDSSITKYQVQKRTGAAWGSWADIPDSAPGEANAASYTVTGLSNGTAYWFRIRAVNAVDNGPRSDTAGPARPFTTARTPARNTGGTIWSATLTVDRNGAFAGCDNSDAGRDDCSNALSDDDFGYDGVSYEVDRLYWAAEGGDVLYMAFKNVPGTVAKSRFYRLILNVNGRPFAVADSTGHVYQVYWDVPDPGWTDGQRIRVSLAAVPISGLRAEPGVTQVKLGWNNPSSCTVAAKCSYRIDYRKAGDRWASGPSFTSLTTATVPDLLQATEYEFRIFRRVGGATRAMGLVTAVTKTPAQPPGQPQGLAARAGHEWVELRWNDPGDPAIGGYQYRQKQVGSDWGGWIDIADSGNGTTYHKITDLAGDRAYRFQIRAVNAKGDGPASAEASAEPWAPVHVKSIDIVSSPHRGDTYHAQEEIVVEVTFSSEVKIITQTHRRLSPSMGLDLHVGTKADNTPVVRVASFSGLSGNRVRFTYRVVATDEDSDGIAIPANAIKRSSLSGTALRDARDGYGIRYSHDAVAAQSGHKVSGLGDVRRVVGPTSCFSATPPTGVDCPAHGGAPVLKEIVVWSKPESEITRNCTTNSDGNRSCTYVRAADDTYNRGETIRLGAVFHSGHIGVSGQPTFSFIIGSNPVRAIYVGRNTWTGSDGTERTVLYFEHVVLPWRKGYRRYLGPGEPGEYNPRGPHLQQLGRQPGDPDVRGARCTERAQGRGEYRQRPQPFGTREIVRNKTTGT